MWRDPWLWLATVGGAGCVPRAPGTVGTLVAVPIAFALSPLPLPARLLAALAALAIAIPVCTRAARLLGARDPAAIVLDEVAGFLLVAAAAPPGASWLAAAFAGFRVLDILKPWPAGWLERRLPGGAGIVLDDVVAALYTLVILQLLSYNVIG